LAASLAGLMPSVRCWPKSRTSRQDEVGSANRSDS
jgi:hypothetical protein